MNQLPKKLYHVTLDLDHPGVFEARVPKSRMKSEDNTIPRICVSDTVEGCLTSTPFGSHYLDESLMENSDLIKIFVIDTEKLGLLSSDILSPSELYQDGKVDDAMLTNEHWILRNITVPEEDHMVVTVTGFDDTDWKYRFSHSEKAVLDKLDIDWSDYDAVDEACFEHFGTESQSVCIIKDVSFEVVKDHLISA